ncbi:MAG: sugar ABC transporter ATP-binding protein [Flavobacterium sp.]|nr:sugar ABC transporter ATP-binding protein [Flavobacterium sp.]
MKEAVVVFEKITKSYPFYHHIVGIKNFLFALPSSLKAIRTSRFEALRDVSFEVYRGETFGIIGRNGAGKSTLLGLIAGVLRADKGEIMVKERVSPLLELGAGFHPELTGKENIVLNGVLLGLTRKDVLKKMDEIIDFSELANFIDQPIRTYSSGMLARLGFSVIIHLEPEILLIDEVLAVGDIDFQKKCIDKMMDFKKGGVTIILVSHSMEDVKKICDRVMLVEEHTVKMLGEPDEVIASYSKR